MEDARSALYALKKYLTFLTEENFRYFERVKHPQRRILALLKPLESGIEDERILKALKKAKALLENFEKLPDDKKKRLISELHAFFTLKVDESKLSKQSRQRIVTQSASSFKSSKRKVKIEDFFKSLKDVDLKIKNSKLKILEKLGIMTLYDLLTYYPFRYEDRSSVVPLKNVRAGDKVLVKGKVMSVSESEKLLKVVLYDRTSSISLAFLKRGKRANFYIKRIKKEFLLAKEKKKEVIAYGSVSRGKTIFHPEWEIEGISKSTGKIGVIFPVYHTTESLQQNRVRQTIHELVKLFCPYFPEYLPQSLLKDLNFPQIDEAFWFAHMPSGNPEDFVEFKSPHIKRLIFDEFLLFQLALLKSRLNVKSQKGISFRIERDMIESFEKSLPFKLTNAQKKVLKEVAQDMQSEKPMNRLIQGDVGSGKTVVAAGAAYLAVSNGFQVAVMAPTEILARQLYEKFSLFLKPFKVKLALLTGSMGKREKERVYKALKTGYVDVLVGTHAIIQEGVAFKNLGLAIIDEQHRFGVKQRGALVNRDRLVDALVMSATPIPRTLAMTLYGDLDISTIDELPSGRKPIKTKVIFEDQRKELISFLKRELESGGQVYIIYPLIEESEALNLKSATEMFPFWQKALSPFKAALLHGRLPQSEKESVMKDFKEGKVQVLVSTTVVEVGVDVPQATVMVIEHADRFGLAQLHQLRGRVGRGERQSYCFLVAPRKLGEDAVKRLRVLEQTSNGFEVAEADLKFRGPGQVFGTRQSGMGDFKIADVSRDYELLKTARERAKEIFANLDKAEYQNLKKLLSKLYEDRFELGSVS